MHNLKSTALSADFGEAFCMRPAKKPGRVLILDGDGLCYHAAHTSARLDTAIRKVHQDVLTKMFLTGAETARVHLTGLGSKKAMRGSIRAAKPYQGNRKGKPKPPLLEPLREALEARGGLAEADFLLHYDVEADDAMVMESYLFRDNGVVASEDKDLRQVLYPYYDSKLDTVDAGSGEGWVGLREYERTGAKALTGRGMVFFWAQMLTGDTADNVQGLVAYEGKACGPVRAAKLLEGKSETECANTVIDAYRAINQNVVAEGWLLYLLQHPKDDVIQYMDSLDLTYANKTYVEECTQREWFVEVPGCT